MPDIRKDSHSGALIFDLTPTEAKVIDLENTVNSLTEKLADIEQKISDNSSTASKTKK